MAGNVTIMVLRVDLECKKCYKKVKKLLCKYREIRDQVYDEKVNTVTITVVCCCSPEKMRDELCCKGRGTIKSIDIKEPDKPKPDNLTPVDTMPSKPASPKPHPTYGVCFVPYYVDPCYRGHDMPKLAPPCYCGCGRGSLIPPCNCGCGTGSLIPLCNCGCRTGSLAPPCNCGCGRGYTVNRCDYFIEENPAGCAVM